MIKTSPRKFPMRASVGAAALSLTLAAGCGGSSNNEVDIVAGEQSIPVLNKDPKAPMSNIDVSNEAQHPEVMKGTIATPGRN